MKLSTLFFILLACIIAKFLTTYGFYPLPNKYRPLDCRELGMRYEQTIIDGQLAGERCLPSLPQELSSTERE